MKTRPGDLIASSSLIDMATKQVLIQLVSTFHLSLSALTAIIRGTVTIMAPDRHDVDPKSVAPVVIHFNDPAEYGRRMEFGMGNRRDTLTPFDTAPGPIIHPNDFTTSFCPVETRITAQVFRIMAASMTSNGILAKPRQLLVGSNNGDLFSEPNFYQAAGGYGKRPGQHGSPNQRLQPPIHHFTPTPAPAQIHPNLANLIKDGMVPETRSHSSHSRALHLRSLGAWKHYSLKQLSEITVINVGRGFSWLETNGTSLQNYLNIDTTGTAIQH